MRRFTAYIFDLDGVLCHTDKFHFAAWAALAKKLDLPFDASVNDRLRGVSRMESLDIVLGEKKDAFTAEQNTVLLRRRFQQIGKLLQAEVCVGGICRWADGHSVEAAGLCSLYASFSVLHNERIIRLYAKELCRQ